MAFTKAPEYNTHQLNRFPVEIENRFDPTSGQAYMVYENCLPTLEGKEVVVTKRAPVNSIATMAGTLPRGLFIDPQSNYIYIAYDDDLTGINDVSPLLSGTTAGMFSNTSGPMNFTGYLVGTTSYVVNHEPTSASGSYLRYWLSGNYGTPDTITNVAVNNMRSSIVFLDGYLFIAGNSQRIYNSTLGSPTTWNTSTDFIDAEMFNDNIVALAKHHNHLVVLGKESVEFFYNSGNEIGSPLSRQANYSQRIGMVDISGQRPLLAEIGDIIYFLGGEGGAYNGVYKIENFKISKVSDLWMDDWLTQAAANTPVLSVYEHYGIACLAVSSGLFTFVYKPDTKTWSSLVFNRSLYDSVFGNYFGEGGTYLLTYDPDTSNIRLMKSGYRDPQSQAQADAESFSATYITDVMDFNTNSQRHMKWVDVLGWMGNNTVTLQYTRDYENSAPVWTNCETKTQNVIGTKNPLRWRNLGRTRGHRFQIIFSGSSDIKFKGLEISYNMGTH